MVLFGMGLGRSVTGEDGWSGFSRGVSDVRRTPRLVSWSALILTVGIHTGGKGENLSSRSGVRRKTPRLVVQLFGWFLVFEESKIDASDSTGDQMEVPRVVV
jgi:hypothetical protein